MSSAIYATPVITDLYSDGHKDIIVPSFVHYTEVGYLTGCRLLLRERMLMHDVCDR